MIRPYKHQEEAINDIVYSDKGLINKDKVQYISACGTGKTNTALWSVERYLFDYLKLKSSISIFFYPSLALISQSFQNYKTLTRIENYKPIFICSDSSIADNEDMNIDELKEELGNYLVTTTNEEILSYLNDDIEHKTIYW